MTEEHPQIPRAEYHLEQFIKVTEEHERTVLLEEYDLLKPVETPVPKGILKDDESDPLDVKPSNEFEEIAVREAGKQGVTVVGVDTVEAGPEHPDVKKNVKLEIEHEGIVAEFHFVKERSEHVDVEPVTLEWYEQAVSTILKYNSFTDE
jgi:hypothetical protein